MKSQILLLNALASIAGASPLVEPRQLLNFDLLDDTPDPVTASIPVSATAATQTYNLAAATQSAISAPLVEKRELNKREACDPEPVGAGPIPSTDTAAAFLAFSDLSDAAENAAVPAGYVSAFTNLQASSSAYGYLGFTNLDSYDPAACAAKCDTIGDACSGVNIYFERDPSVTPGAGCPNPASTTNIKCVFWGGSLNTANSKNVGSSREQFEVVIAGSNGYMKTRVPKVTGYNGVSLGDFAVNAPLNCLGQDTFMGSKVFSTSYFDPSLCAAACASETQYNVEHPSAGEAPKICYYFVTFLAAENGNPQGQYCSLYTQSWDKSYATNDGQYRGNDHYTNEYAFAYTNSICGGNPACPKGTHDAY
ncbi:hypothetical protein GGR57DRAFT_492494 [Xylariaceae sp. FL1272]|nr:hypothetical protein GGR57DRAFT_492494 [Xylariaceae sp. FL1272]